MPTASVSVSTILVSLVAISIVANPASRMALGAQWRRSRIRSESRRSGLRMGVWGLGCERQLAPGAGLNRSNPGINSFEPSFRRAGRWLSSSALTLQLDGDTYPLARSDLFGAFGA